MPRPPAWPAPHWYATSGGAWALIGAGLLIWTGGEIYFEAAVSISGTVPIPSPADACYLAFDPLTYAGLIALVPARTGVFTASRLLDGLIAGLAVAAVALLSPLPTAARTSRPPPTSPTRSET